MSSEEQHDRQSIRKNERESDSLDSSRAPIVPSSELSGDILDLERARIETANKQIDIHRLAIEAQNAADQRQYAYHVKVLENQREKEFEDRKISSRLLIILIIGIFLLIGISVFNAFWGDDTNRETALNIFGNLFKLIGGYGIFKLLEPIGRKFFTNTNR